MAEAVVRNILVVDDEQETCQTISRLLARTHKYKVSQAYNGKAALEHIVHDKPDLIILDVVMPQLDGFEVLRALKSQPQYSKIPVIMLSAKSGPLYVEKGIALNADFYLPKPFDYSNLSEYISLILED